MRFLKSWRALLASVVVFMLLLTGINLLLGSVDSASQQQQAEMVKRAVKRAALTCFALEGRYPQTLDYLAEHYGLRYNANKYIVRYDAFASNVMPDISVLEIGGGGNDEA
ncbi:MAG: hypothetical protein RSJ41_09405 [Clostridia bacterium]